MNTIVAHHVAHVVIVARIVIINRHPRNPQYSCSHINNSAPSELINKLNSLLRSVPKMTHSDKAKKDDPKNTKYFKKHSLETWERLGPLTVGKINEKNPLPIDNWLEYDESCG